MAVSYCRGSTFNYSSNFEENLRKIFVIFSTELVKPRMISVKEYLPLSK
jgi:hypothetical protein